MNYGKQGALLRTCNCPPPCKERVLNKVTSNSEWPTKSYAAYFATLLQRSTSRQVQSFVSRAIKESNNGTNYAQLRDILAQNFARVEISFESLSSYEIKEVPKYNFATLCGTLGGNMGLWLGWSIMALFEIVQWIYACMKTIMARK